METAARSLSPPVNQVQRKASSAAPRGRSRSLTVARTTAITVTSGNGAEATRIGALIAGCGAGTTDGPAEAASSEATADLD